MTQPAPPEPEPPPILEPPPPKEEGATLPETVGGLLDALRHGDVVAIFPEGGVRKERHPAVGEFAPGVIYLQRRTAAEERQ